MATKAQPPSKAEQRRAGKTPPGPPPKEPVRAATGAPRAAPPTVEAAGSAPARVAYFRAPGAPASPPLTDAEGLQRRLGPGAPLPRKPREAMEAGLGTPLGGVRVHTDINAAQLARGMAARAFTVGQHVAFGAGEYQPGTLEGDALLAHELAHVGQQTGVTQFAGESPSSGAGAFEDAAHRAAAGALLRNPEHRELLTGGKVPASAAAFPAVDKAVRGETDGHVEGTPPPIQLQELGPRTTLDPTYADTPKAGKLPEESLFDHEMLVDGDGDQVPELKMKFSSAAHDKDTLRTTRIRVSVEQLQAAGVKKKPAPLTFEFPVLDYMRPLTSPHRIRPTDGHTATMFYFSADPSWMSEWAFEMLPEPEMNPGEMTYRCTVWFPKQYQQSATEEADKHDFRLPAGRTALHNVFRPQDPVQAAPDLWTLDMDVGAYSDPFRLTFQKPTPGTDQLEIGLVAVQEGTTHSHVAPFKTTLAGALKVKVLETKGAQLSLDLDGDGKVDLYVYDRLTAQADLSSYLQLPQVELFREHVVSLVREPTMLGAQTATFRVEKGQWQPTVYSGATNFETASSAAAAEGIQKLGVPSSYAEQVQRVEQMRVAIRSKAAPALIQQATLDKLNQLARDIAAQRTNGLVFEDPKAPRTAALRQAAVAADANALFTQLKTEPKLADQMNITATLVPDGGAVYSGDNPYTGEFYTQGFFSWKRIWKSTLEELADAASAGKWNDVYKFFGTVENQLDSWIEKRLKDEKRGDEAKQLHGLIELTGKLEKLSGKKNVTPITAVFHAREAWEQGRHDLQSMQLLLYYYQEDNDWKLTDLTRPEKPFTVHVPDKGEKVPPHELFLKLNDKDELPKGYVHYVIPGPDGRSGRVECTADLTWSDYLMYASLGLAAVGLIAFTGGAGSVVVTGIFVASGVAGAASATLDIIHGYQNGSLTADRVGLDAVIIIGSLAGAGAGIAGEVRGAAAAVQAGKNVSPAMRALAGLEGVGKLFVPLKATATVADTIQFLHFAAEVPAALAAIDSSGGTDTDRLRAKVLLLTQLAAMGSLTMLSVKGAGAELGAAKPPNLLIEVVDGVPWARFSFSVAAGEYEQAVNGALSAQAKKTLGTVEVKTIKAAEMATLTGSPTNRATVIIEGGKPKVLVLEGASVNAAAEEVVHLEQLADPKLRKPGLSLDEAQLAKYPTLPPGEQLKLTRNKLTLEIDAQKKLINQLGKGVEADLTSGALVPGSPEANARFAHLEEAWQNLEHLRGKDTALVGVEKQLAAGKSISDPSLIADTPRLLNKPAAPGFELDASWRFASKDEFVAAYQAKYPNSSLSKQELELRWEQGKRLNPSSWHMATGEKPPVVVRPENEPVLGPETKTSGPGSSDMPLTATDRKNWEDLIKKRDKALATKRSLEATGQESDALRKARYELNESSRQIGEFTATQYVKNTYPNVELPPLYGGGISRPGEFDLVFRYTEGGKVKYIVVEAKGGGAGLGTREVGGETVRQGNMKYYNDIVANMASGKLGPQAETVGKALQLADAKDVSYILVKTPFQPGDTTVVAAVKVAAFH